MKRCWYLLNGFERCGIDSTLWTIDPFGESAETTQIPWADEILPDRVFAGRARRGVGNKLKAFASAMPEEIWMRPISRELATADLQQFDVALLLGPAAAQIIPRLNASRIPVAMDLHDVPDRLQRRIATTLPGRIAKRRTMLDSRKWVAAQRSMLDRSALTVTVSEEDAATLRKMTTRPIVVRPNGVDLESYEFVDHSQPTAASLLFTATFSYFPNIDAARWLLGEILPQLRAQRHDVTLDLIGHHAPAGPFPAGVRAASDVPLIQPWFDAADVFVAPLRAGTGTRLKILEALAKGLPCVTTTIGCEGLPVEDGVHVLVADTTQEFVLAVLRLLDDVALRQRLAANGRALVERQFDWSAITDAYAADLLALARPQVASGS